MAVEKIQVPDLGTDDSVEVIEILVKAGDSIGENDSLVVLESDKAAMEIPAPKAGIVKKVLVELGAQVKTGMPLIELEAQGAAGAEPDKAAETESSKDKPVEKTAEKTSEQTPENKPAVVAAKASTTGALSVQNVSVPDLGTDEEVEVIEILVSVGDVVDVEGGLLTLETDKAAMDVPAPFAGTVKTINVKVGDKVKTGAVIMALETSAAADPAAEASVAKAETHVAKAEAPVAAKASSDPVPATASESQADSDRPPVLVVPAASENADVYAGPAVRKLAREFGLALNQVPGSGAKGRIVKEDLHAFVKARLQGGAAPVAGVAGGTGIPGIPDVDFSKFGEIEELEMSKLHRVTAANMTRNWLNVPMVTQFDEADITDMESFRAAQKALAEKKGTKLTPLPFIIKACAQALAQYPQFNVSLHSSGTKLIQKKYINIGVAVATPAGLMVPVIKNVDKKSIWEISKEVAELSARAKERKLGREDMEGACFTISSLGNMGGTAFTPIVNAPEVAILGVSRASIKPVYKDGQFVPRTMMPYSLSYDHRAVNGVDGGMFCTYLGQLLSDIRLMVL